LRILARLLWDISGHPPGLFNNLINAGKERRRYSEAERFSGLEAYRQLEFGRALNRKVSGLLAFKDAVDVASGLPEWIDRV